jgi:hypothetical protein
MCLKMFKNAKNMPKIRLMMSSKNLQIFPASHRVATIICRTPSSSWYPKAFHQMKRGFCDFSAPVAVITLRHNDVYSQITSVIGKKPHEPRVIP